MNAEGCSNFLQCDHAEKDGNILTIKKQKIIKIDQLAETLKFDVAIPFHLEIIFKMYNFMDKNSMTSQIQREI